METIEILNKKFSFYEDEIMWLSPLNEVGNEATFEVYDRVLNIPLVTKILHFFNSEKHLSLQLKSKKLLSNLSANFWDAPLLNPVFHFSGITLKKFHRAVDFQILFQLSSDDLGSDYANWIVEIKDFKIVGVFREQL